MDSYSFRILNERASDVDVFDDKTHEKAALNLHRVIESSPSAVTIGLEGGWGSGKSTVVNLLRKALLKDEKNTLLYLFDAWAHDGDPLRRIFLEGLINEIDPEAQEEHLKEVRNEITGKKKRVEIKSRKSTSKLGGFLSLSAIFVPLGAALLSAIDYNTVHWFSNGIEIHWPFLSGLVFTLAPLWTLIFWAIFSSKSEKNKSSKWPLNKNWDVFASDSEENYSQDITEDGERTSIEFERIFGQIMAHSVGDDKKYKRALIIIDNLDRIEPEQTLSIWSILQTFFQYRNNSDIGKHTWQERLWFLIPYDREGLSKVWQSASQKSNSSLYSPEAISEIETNTERAHSNSVADSFLEKCFQLVEEVPEPVLTSWVEYCQYRVEEALTGWPEESRTIVIDTYKRYESSLTRSPSPRQIQAFINKVGMLGMRWGEDISPEAIALYALVRRKRSERQLRAELLKIGLPDNYQANNESELKAELAGILFGVNKDKGIQLLLEPEIREALNNGDSDKIFELIRRHGEAFWIIWNTIKESALPRDHIEEYRIKATKAFCLGIEGHTDRAEQDIDHLLKEWRSRELKWELDRHDYKEAMEALISALGSRKNEFINWLTTKVSTELSKSITMFGKEGFKEEALYNIRSLMDYLKTLNIKHPKKRYSELNNQSWNAWLKTLNRLNLSFTEVLPDKKVLPALIESIDVNNAGGEALNTIIQTLEIYSEKADYKAITLKLMAWMVNPNHALALDSAYELLIKCYLNADPDSEKQIMQSLTNPHFIQRTAQESVDNLPALTAFFAIVYDDKLLEKNLPVNISNFFQTAPSVEMVDKILSVLEKNNALSTIWELARSPKNKFATTAILSSTSSDGRIYAVDEGALYFDEYLWAKDSDLEAIINRLISKNSFERVKDSYIEEPNTFIKCLKILSKRNDEYGKEFIDGIIPKVNAKNWKKSFEKNSGLLHLISEKGNHEFKDGVLEFIQEDLKSREANAGFWDEFSIVFHALPDKKTVIRKILKEYFQLDHDPFNDKSFLELAGCISPSDLAEIPPHLTMARVELWISTDQWNRIKWLVKHDITPPDTVSESLVSRLNASQPADKEHSEIIEKLASIYGVKISETDSVANTVDE
ncbi:P-loop NTPase fold protein [Thalassolituus oleivorans]|uniref:P-loop NTPase fold protein n=1 Tax=Thalassolituus oleivorans TaxID=187493 RepID=UPI0030C86DFE